MNHWKENIKVENFTFNQLPITYLQRKGFRSWMAYLSCSYGSMETGFPDGSAHFLEHRLFFVNGQEATELFSSFGADVNAFTSRRIMGFYFSTLRNYFDSIQLLLDLVLQEREFNQEAIENEKKIIESEIMMVEDDPYTKGYQSLLEQLFPKHPLCIKIAGTKESISSINPGILKTIHSKYFNPSTCKLIICGSEEPKEFIHNFHQKIVSTLWNPQKKIKPSYYFEEPKEISANFLELKMPVTKDLLFLGIKTKKKKLTLRDSLVGEFICHILFGSISSFTDKMYTKNYMDDSFTFSYDWDIDYGCLVLSSYSSHSTSLLKQIQKEIQARLKTGISQEDFTIIQNYFLGSSYTMIDNPSDLMMHLTNLAWLKDKTWEDYLQEVSSLTLQTVNDELSNFLSLEYSAVSIIHPL